MFESMREPIVAIIDTRLCYCFGSDLRKDGIFLVRCFIIDF